VIVLAIALIIRNSDLNIGSLGLVSSKPEKAILGKWERYREPTPAEKNVTLPSR
jgi:hypothetical protein